MRSLKSIVKKIMETASFAFPNANNLETQCTFHQINYDQANGIGNVPDNQNVNYKGFTVIMTPEQFLRLVPNRGNDRGISYFKNQLRLGASFGSPFLIIDMDDGPIVKVTNHEGRGRMIAIKHVYNKDWPVLVQIFPRGGLRARNITQKMVASFRNKAIPQQSNYILPGPHFEENVWLNKNFQAVSWEDHPLDAPPPSEQL